MDIVNEIFDTFMGDYAYAKLRPMKPAPYDFPRSTNATGEAQVFSSWQYEPATQYFSLEPSQIFGLLVYFLFASLSYIFVFDKGTFNHPKYLKNQIRLEIRQTMLSMPVMSVLTLPFFLAEVRGHTKCYDGLGEQPFAGYNWLQFPLFLVFTDLCIYWIHRGLHHPAVYKTLHKPHHRWIMPTPYASHAFHPVDGWAQALPYHVFPLLFPLQKLAYVGLFVFVNFWTILIHDGEYVANSPIVNGAACHTMHHLYFNYNYGQYTTVWDRLGGSYRRPNDELFARETKFSTGEWARQSREMEKMVREVEGVDDRQYDPVVESKKSR
ncbi:c-5 sterol desaturase [Pestalotiopsis sp. 9143b]|nr:c-5 sterol desaturase [Pestalotiopsis sp. 9143b]